MYLVTNYYHYAKKTVYISVYGRLEPGDFTCYTFIRNTFAASVVDYIIINNLFKCTLRHHK